ncbi:MAG: hypothetical protein AAGC95_03365 [Pseudomonadota bacterium]
MLIAFKMVRWDMRLQARSHLYTATVLTTLAFCLTVYLLAPFDLERKWLAFLLFMDPAVIGLSFVGAFILMERGGKTLSALATTPLQGWVYVFGKIASFAILGSVSGACVAFVASGGHLIYPTAALSLLMTNAAAVLLGFALAAPAATVNAFLARMSIAMLIVTTPALGYLGLVPDTVHMALAVIPTYSMLVLLEAGFAQSAVSVGEYIVHGVYLLAWTIAGWFWSVRAYERHMRVGDV